MSATSKIQTFIIKHLQAHPQDIVAYTMAALAITRTTVRRHVNHLIDQGKVYKTGTTRNIYYGLKESFEKKVIVNLPSKLGEYEIFKENFEPSCRLLPRHVQDICSYGVTEMINNAFEHANARKVVIEMHQDMGNIIFMINDDGVGIFQKISDFLHFSDLRESILQINKGKFTTDRKNHSGEGVFFTSRVFDTFKATSNGITYQRNNLLGDWFIKSSPEKHAGTLIELTIGQHCTQTLIDVFQNFQNPESLAFDRTEIIVDLSKFGEEVYISRSQAKRILRNLEEFNVITLDFNRVRMIGQGFADEVFRVYQQEHQGKEIKYLNANDDIVFMIKRAVATGPQSL